VNSYKTYNYIGILYNGVFMYNWGTPFWAMESRCHSCRDPL
jgi:hypothetical protein